MNHSEYKTTAAMAVIEMHVEFLLFTLLINGTGMHETK